MISFDSFIKVTVGFISGLTFVTLLMFVYYFFDLKESAPNLIQAIGAFSTGLSAFIALLAFIWNHIKNRSQDLVHDAILNLERAFEILTQGNAGNGPSKDRLVWLTSARHIKTFEDIKNNLRDTADSTQYQILLSHEEYWRSKFYTLMRGMDNRGYPEHFYHDPTKEIDENQLAPSSLAVIYKFMDWPEEKEDPLSGLDDLTIFLESNILLLNPGMRSYLKRRFKKYERALNIHEDS